MALSTRPQGNALRCAPNRLDVMGNWLLESNSVSGV